MKRILFPLLTILLWTTYIKGFSQNNYWQQKADYDIQVQLIDTLHQLKGLVQITYQNNSPDNLSELYVHLYPNAYSSKKTALSKDKATMGDVDFYFAKQSDMGYIKNIDFLVNGTTVKWSLDAKHPDIAHITLNEPLISGSKCIITTPFLVKLPKLNSRSGYLDGMFAVTQWFPKIAAYDKSGWHAMPYLEKGEFFDEFGDYKVNIALPEKYKVAATGVLQKETLQDGKKTLIFEQKNVHDFAWFASKKFIVIEDTMTLPSGRIIQLKTFSLSEDNSFSHANDYIQKAILHYSTLVGEYPYDVCTVVEGEQGSGSGMEYPMVTIIESQTSPTVVEEVIVHEVGHNWWQGILASNERLSPWIDEGINTYYEKRYYQGSYYLADQLTSLKERKVASMLGVNELPEMPLEKYGVLMQQRLGKYQPQNEHSADMSMLNYGIGVYGGTAIDFQLLEANLGTPVFDKCIQTVYTKYQFKHLYPENIQESFEEISGKDLDWFFNSLISTDKIIDISLKNLEETTDGYLITLKNKGELAVPVQIGGITSDGVRPITWVDPFYGDTSILIEKGNYSEIVIDPEWQLKEFTRSNNYYKLNKGLPKFEKLQLHLFGGLENPHRTQLSIAPVFAGNKYDKFMFGVALYNRTFPAKSFEYAFVPMFAVGSKRLSGIFNVDYYWKKRPAHTQEIKTGVHVSTFSFSSRPTVRNYVKVEPHLKMIFKPGGQGSHWMETLQFRHVFISEQNPVYDTADFSNFSLERTSRWYNELSYRVDFTRKIYPFFSEVKILHSQQFLRASWENKIKLNYGSINNKYFGIRLFAGGFLWRKEDFRFGLNPQYGYNISATTGQNDFLLDGYYFGRSENEGFTSKQLINGDGNFKTISSLQGVNIGKTANWLMSVNLTADFPWKYLPIQFFMDFGYSFNNTIPFGEPLPVKNFYYDGGFSLNFLEEALQIHFPLFMSKEFKDFYKASYPGFKGRISYTFDLKKLNPHEKIRDIGSMIKLF